MKDEKLRFFTVREAERMIPRIEEIVRKVADVKDRLSRSLTDAMALKAKTGNNDDRELFKNKLMESLSLQKELSSCHLSLIKEGLVVRDYTGGAIDFPTIIENDIGYLSWRSGETSIQYWHSVGSPRRLPITGEVKILG